MQGRSSATAAQPPSHRDSVCIVFHKRSFPNVKNVRTSPESSDKHTERLHVQNTIILRHTKSTVQCQLCIQFCTARLCHMLSGAVDVTVTGAGRSPCPGLPRMFSDLERKGPSPGKPPQSQESWDTWSPYRNGFKNPDAHVNPLTNCLRPHR